MPTRPPPPPEELRPDLSLFMPQIGSRCVIGRGSGGGEELHTGDVWSREREGENSRVIRKGLITKTQGWDVRYDDCHVV
jgi:hypothetical protein